MTLSVIKRCIEVTDAQIATAIVSRSGAKALLDHMAKIGRPNEGAPKILIILARMAVSGDEWLDGDLRVEVVGDGDVSIFEVMTELGGGLRERALPSFAVNVPLAEFVGAVERVPRMIEPLAVKAKSDRRLVLVTGPGAGARTLPPPPVAIAEEHLIEPPPSPKNVPSVPSPPEKRSTSRPSKRSAPAGAPPPKASPKTPSPPAPAKARPETKKERGDAAEDLEEEAVDSGWDV